MVSHHHTDGRGNDGTTGAGTERKDRPTEDATGKADSTPEKDGADGGDADGTEDGSTPPTLIDRRSLLKAGAVAAGTAVGAVASTDSASAAIDVADQGDYEVWTISGSEVYDLSDGEVLSNVLVDQTADGACLTIRSRDRTDWVVRNVGFLGVGQVSDSTAYQLQVSAPSGGQGLIENVWANGKARNGQPGTELGGIYVRSSHAGHIDVRNTYIEGFGNNAVYASAVGKDGGDDGSVTIENAYHRDNTSSQFRIGSPGSVVRNSVGVINDPDGDRGNYPGSDSKNARGAWGKHYPDQRVENCAFYVSPDDVQPDGAFEARYIEDRSHGEEAVLEAVDCNMNPDAPSVSESTSNAMVNFTNLGENPTVTVIQDGGVPLSPEMAARGERSMPPELPGADGSGGGGGSGDSGGGDSSTSLDRTLTVDGRGAERTDYTFTVSGTIENNPDVGTFDADDSADGSTASGFVNGGVDGYRFSGDVTDAVVEGNAAILVDGQEVDPATLGDQSSADGDPAVTTAAASDVTGTAATLNGSLDGLGGADSADVAFEWREASASSWTGTATETLSSAGSFSRNVTGLSADTSYEYRAVATASDGDTATGSTATFATAASSTPGNQLSVTKDGAPDGKAEFQVTVSGDLQPADDFEANGSDSIDGHTATGIIGPESGTDTVHYSGEVTDFSLDGPAVVFVNGEEVDPATLGSGDGSSLPRTIVIDGSTVARTDYEFAVSGEVTADGSAGALEGDDAIDGRVASGFVDGDVDAYRFSGDVVGITVDGDATVVVDGQAVDPGSLVLTNHIVFDGNGSGSETTYELQVSGELVNDPLLGPLESGDAVDGTTVTGTVSGDDRDGFRFTGNVVGLAVDGQASVVFEDNDG